MHLSPLSGLNKASGLLGVIAKGGVIVEGLNDQVGRRIPLSSNLKIKAVIKETKVGENLVNSLWAVNKSNHPHFSTT